MSRIGSSQPNVVVQVARLIATALCVAGLSGCGSTIVTRIHTRDVILSFPIDKRENQARRLEKQLKILPTKPGDRQASAAALVHWAGADAERLTLAAESLLLAHARGSQEISGFSLAAMDFSWRSLRSSGVPPSQWLETPATRRTIAIYNAALDRFVAIHGSDLARGRTDDFWTPVGGMEVSTEFVARAPYRAGYFDTFILADHVSIRGMGKRVRTSGLGVALVGSRERTPEREKEMFYQPAGRGVYVPFAAVAEFDPGPATEARIRLIDLNRASTITIAGGRVALSGDFTAPFALSFRGINDLMMGISGIINVEKREKDAGLYLTEPFDPDRIPVVMIHGLSSSPLVWRTIATSLLSDPSIRRNYQFWYVYYPTGMPILESAASIRDEIAAIRKAYDPRGTSIASRHLVLVGYSMGGVIAQILSTSSGNRLWDAIAKVPFDQAAIDSEDRAELEKLLFWKPVPGLDRTIFIATPHRGTRFADSRLAGIGGRLVRLPGDFLQFQMRMLNALGEILQGDFATMGVMTGITSLSPSAPLYKALDGAPFAPGLKYHSIIGDRGRGGGVESTDGIVGYWSSHIAGAKSELIVPTGHDAHLHPKTIADLRRILLSNIRRR
jgi:pimeloyl-ACP methyl ester carboxylesterase